MDSAITQLRGRCTIAWAWSMLGLPGRPSKHCRSPFRDELRPSFSVYKAGDGERWHDHGEGKGGDVVDLWARAKGLSVKEAVADILRVVPGVEAPNRPPEAFKPVDGIRWPPDIRMPQEKECHALGALRGLSPEAFFLAGRLGTLKVATRLRAKKLDHHRSKPALRGSAPIRWPALHCQRPRAKRLLSARLQERSASGVKND